MDVLPVIQVSTYSINSINQELKVPQNFLVCRDGRPVVATCSLIQLSQCKVGLGCPLLWTDTLQLSQKHFAHLHCKI